MSFSFGVALSASGNILATPVRLIFDEFLAWSDSRTYSYSIYTENPSPGLGTQIAQAVCPSLPPCNCEDSSTLKFGSAIHAVLVSELQLFSREEDRVSHLQHIVTTCMIFMHPSISYRASTDILHSTWDLFLVQSIVGLTRTWRIYSGHYLRLNFPHICNSYVKRCLPTDLR